jgi:hypothetical protein
MRAPKDVFCERIRAVDSDSAEEACWNVSHVASESKPTWPCCLGCESLTVYI